MRWPETPVKLSCRFSRGGRNERAIPTSMLLAAYVSAAYSWRGIIEHVLGLLMQRSQYGPSNRKWVSGMSRDARAIVHKKSPSDRALGLFFANRSLATQEVKGGSIGGMKPDSGAGRSVDRPGPVEDRAYLQLAVKERKGRNGQNI